MSEKPLINNKKGLDKKTIISIVFCLVISPAIVLAMWKLGGRSFYIGSVAMIFIAMVPFFLSFEGRKPDARELVVIAVMSAIATASRIAFIAVPHFKPVMAIIMIAGITFGAQAGFLTGSISALVSNFVYGQGPWTPWQMFAYGMAGFVAGLLARKSIMTGKKPLKDAIISVVIIMVIVGPLLDTESVFTLSSKVNLAAFATFFSSGLPVNLVLAACTFVTILLISKPMTEKLERIKVKYGMMEK